MSFKGEEWELYNIAADRCELKNLAASEPERLQSMIERWRKMARDVLHSDKLPTLR